MEEISYFALTEMRDGRIVVEGSDFDWPVNYYPTRIIVHDIPGKGNLTFSNRKLVHWIGSDGYAYKNKESGMEIQVFND